MKELYSTTKALGGKYTQANKPVKYTNGTTLTTTEEQMNKWAEYFEELLNRPAPLNGAYIQPTEEILSHESYQNIDKWEISRARWNTGRIAEGRLKYFN